MLTNHLSGVSCALAILRLVAWFPDEAWTEWDCSRLLRLHQCALCQLHTFLDPCRLLYRGCFFPGFHSGSAPSVLHSKASLIGSWVAIRILEGRVHAPAA